MDPFLLRDSLGFDPRKRALSRAGAMPEMVLPATAPVVPTVLPLIPVKPLIVVPAVFALLVLRLEEDR